MYLLLILKCFDACRDTRAAALNVMGTLYGAVLFLGVQNSSTVQPVLSVERSVYYREHAAGMYGGLPFALALACVELPYLLVQVSVCLLGFIS